MIDQHLNLLTKTMPIHNRVRHYLVAMKNVKSDTFMTSKRTDKQDTFHLQGNQCAI